MDKTSISFFIISLLSVSLFYFGIGKNKYRLPFIIDWQIIVGTLMVLNVFKFNPQLFPIVIVGTIVMTYVLLKQIDLHVLQPKILLAIHTLRIPVELVLYQLYLQQKVPYMMTFKGWNFDIFIGITAVIIFLYQLSNQRKMYKPFFIIWNMMGILFLFFIVALAILSSPIPIQQFAFDQPNKAVLEFPFCFLPTCVVPIVFISHVLLIKSIRKQ